MPEGTDLSSPEVPFLRLIPILLWSLAALPVWAAPKAPKDPAAPQPKLIQGEGLAVEEFDDGSYVLRSASVRGDMLRAEVEVDTAQGTLRPSLYPRHLKSVAPFSDELGRGQMLTVTHTGLAGTPDLICEYRVYANRPWGDIRVTVRNSTVSSIEVHSIHVAKSKPGTVADLNGPARQDLVLSDRYSEDIPYIRMLGEGNEPGGGHLAFGSQLIYNRQSGQSLFLAALSADRMLTVFHLASSGSYDIEDSGTNEALKEQQQAYPAANTVPFTLQIPAGESLSSERLMFAAGSDYHAQLESYGQAIRILHKAMVSTPPLMGWWSWTAYYYGVTENTVLTNAAWLAQNLEPLGYRYFQVDEGYQYARGEYATPDGKAFPHGMARVAHQVEDRGITFGLWVAPFEVSERSWVYEHHRVRTPSSISAERPIRFTGRDMSG